MGKRSKTVGSTVPNGPPKNTAGFAPVPTGSGEEQELGVFAGGLSHDPCRASIADTTAAEFGSPDWDFFFVLFQYLYLAVWCNLLFSRKVSNTWIQPSGHAEFQKDMHTCQPNFWTILNCLEEDGKHKTCMLILPIFCTPGQVGKIKNYNHEKGFGFIVCEALNLQAGWKDERIWKDEGVRNQDPFDQFSYMHWWKNRDWWRLADLRWRTFARQTLNFFNQTNINKLHLYSRVIFHNDRGCIEGGFFFWQLFFENYLQSRKCTWLTWSLWPCGSVEINPQSWKGCPLSLAGVSRRCFSPFEEQRKLRSRWRGVCVMRGGLGFEDLRIIQYNHYLLAAFLTR